MADENDKLAMVNLEEQQNQENANEDAENIKKGNEKAQNAAQSSVENPSLTIDESQNNAESEAGEKKEQPQPGLVQTMLSEGVKDAKNEHAAAALHIMQGMLKAFGGLQENMDKLYGSLADAIKSKIGEKIESFVNYFKTPDLKPCLKYKTLLLTLVMKINLPC